MKQSDTPAVNSRNKPSRNTRVDVPSADGAVAPRDVADLHGVLGDGVAGTEGVSDVVRSGGSELFHVEQLESGIRELSDLVGGLGGELAGGIGGGNGAEDFEARSARMFAHEVNNLVMGISGRAQRAIGSGDVGHVRAALEASAELGGRVSELCRVFLDGGVGDSIKSDNQYDDQRGLWDGSGGEIESGGGKVEDECGGGEGECGVVGSGGGDGVESGVVDGAEFGTGFGAVGREANGLIGGFAGGADECISSGRQVCLCGNEVVALHEFAAGCALGGLKVPGVAGSQDEEGLVSGLGECSGLGFEVEVDAGVVVPMDGVGFGQVLLNLYRNAIGGIERGRAGNEGGVIRMRVMGFGGVAREGGGVLVRVEDSGVGFGDGAGEASDGGVRGRVESGGDGYGLGLDVCRVLAGRFGGRVELGRSGMLGGGRVDLVFV